MSWYGLATFCAVYFLAVAMPGPGVAAVIAQGLARGSAGAPAFIAGFLVGDLPWFCAAVLGLAALAQTAHAAFVLFRYAGALYLLYLAYDTVVPLESLSPFGHLEIASAIAVILPLTLGGYVLIATRARQWLRNPRAVRLVNRGSGTLMAAAAVAVATR
jgi:threonine/homoserine/homoserine lactone efflux protein